MEPGGIGCSGTVAAVLYWASLHESASSLSNCYMKGVTECAQLMHTEAILHSLLLVGYTQH